MEFLAAITNTRPRTGFDKGSLERLEQLFRQTVGHEKEICREDFEKIVISKNVSTLKKCKIFLLSQYSSLFLPKECFKFLTKITLGQYLCKNF